MARCATIAAPQSESAVLDLDTNNSACEGRIYPTENGNIYIGMQDGSLLGPLPGSVAGSGGNFIVPGPFEDDQAAATGGVAIGHMYRISENNDEGAVSPGSRTVVVRLS